MHIDLDGFVINDAPYEFHRDPVEVLSDINREAAHVRGLMVVLDELLEQALNDLNDREIEMLPECFGTVGEKERQLKQHCTEQHYRVNAVKRLIAKAKSRLQYLEMAFESVRTISANRRAEFRAEPTGQWT